MWITLGIVGVVVVALVGVLVFVVPKNINSAGGQGGPGQPTSSTKARPGPTDPLSPRTTLYNNFPATCSLLSKDTVQALYPKAAGKDDKSDSQEADFQDIEHSCDWDADTDDIRYMTIELHGIIGDDALQTITDSYREDDLAKSSPIDKIEGQRSVPNLGDEAKLIYGTQSEGCRLARVMLRSQNATVDVTYGGCDLKGDLNSPTSPISDTVTLNGATTIAREALQRLNSANP